MKFAYEISDRHADELVRVYMHRILAFEKDPVLIEAALTVLDYVTPDGPNKEAYMKKAKELADDT